VEEILRQVIAAIPAADCIPVDLAPPGGNDLGSFGFSSPKSRRNRSTSAWIDEALSPVAA
jgi:hypothetical protein